MLPKLSIVRARLALNCLFSDRVVDVREDAEGVHLYLDADMVPRHSAPDFATLYGTALDALVAERVAERLRQQQSNQ